MAITITPIHDPKFSMELERSWEVNTRDVMKLLFPTPSERTSENSPIEPVSAIDILQYWTDEPTEVENGIKKTQRLRKMEITSTWMNRVDAKVCKKTIYSFDTKWFFKKEKLSDEVIKKILKEARISTRRLVMKEDLGDSLRMEVNAPLTETEFDALWDVYSGSFSENPPVYKKRFLFKEVDRYGFLKSNFVWSVDVKKSFNPKTNTFDRTASPVAFIEVEFSSVKEMESFEEPDWLKKLVEMRK